MNMQDLAKLAKKEVERFFGGWLTKAAERAEVPESPQETQKPTLRIVRGGGMCANLSSCGGVIREPDPSPEKSE